MRPTIDTNVFVYALDARDPLKQRIAVELLSALHGRGGRVALQSIGELYSALTRRLGRAPWEAAQAARNALASFDAYGATESAVETALAEAMTGRFSYWDALLLAAAHSAGCDICFSEDMKDGARLGNVEIVSPFGASGLSDRARSVLSG